jgi:hypothetical protein
MNAHYQFSLVYKGVLTNIYFASMPVKDSWVGKKIW